MSTPRFALRDKAARPFRVLLLCLLALAPQLASAAARGPELTEETIREIEAVVTQEMSRERIPGLTVAVAAGGALRWTGGYGFADIENHVPATARTMLRLASISKPVTAVAVMQLAAEGKLDLDEPVQTCVPAFPKKRWPVTARQLLGHLGGVRHYNAPDEINSTRHYTNAQDPLLLFAADPLVAEPGTKYHYTTYGYVLLGAMVERVAGKPLMDHFRERIFEPAGISAIRDDSVHAIIPRRARGYRYSKAGELENCALADTSNKIPGGGLIGTAESLVRFALAVRDGVLVDRLTVDAMWTPQRLNSGAPTEYGLGWRIGALDGGKRWVGHSGGQQGVSTMLMMAPEDGAAVAVMCNLETGAPRRIAERILLLLIR